jgi:ribose transport system permease protein
MSVLETEGPSARTALPLAGRLSWSEPLGRFGPLAVALLLVIVFTALNPGEFLTGGNVLTLLDQMALPLIVVSGLSLVVVMGCVDLSVEGIMAAAGLAFVLLSANSGNGNDWGVGALAIALLLGAAIGFANGLIHTRMRVPSFILTLGTWYAGLGVASVLYGGSATTLTGGGLVDWIRGTTLGVSTSFWIAVCTVAATLAITRWTTVGRYAYAIGDDENVAAIAGVDVNRYKVIVFGLAGLCSALAGVIGIVRLGAGVVEVGSGQLFFSLTAVVVGGTLLSGGHGGVARSVAGVLLLTVLNNGLVLSGVDPSVQQALFGCVIIVAVVGLAVRQRSIVRVVK